MKLQWRFFGLGLLLVTLCLWQSSALTFALASGRSTRIARGLGYPRKDDRRDGTASPGALWFMAASAGLVKMLRPRTLLHGLGDRVKKDFSVKSAMIRRLGKWRLMKEFDMRQQILDDPKMAKRCGKTSDELIQDFTTASEYLQAQLGLDVQVAEICVSKVATGLNLQFLGKPNIPTSEHMTEVMDWLTENLAVSKEDGSLTRLVEQYPFVLGRTIDDLEESQNFCPEDIDFKVAVADDPALIDKTYNCNGICASQCVACWYNG
mmetsp:Transcript_32320/g.58662  ORF Transcript_32320/g.58662 Transcript_32320/m.58662 type:complete len:264 (+) Transcript_32320:45-836(+)